MESIEKILIRAPSQLKEMIANKSDCLGISMNAFILQILWQWAEENKE